MVVAVLDDIVGCCGWAVIPTIQHGRIGRLTVLLVDAAHRRTGIATAMLEAVTRALRKAGCDRIEVMSDIDIANAHNFFRTLKFTQTSYRFARNVADG
jgi:ribosomal protein S18 acetylase RimI-like enzyme